MLASRVAHMQPATPSPEPRPGTLHLRAPASSCILPPGKQVYIRGAWGGRAGTSAQFRPLSPNGFCLDNRGRSLDSLCATSDEKGERHAESQPVAFYQTGRSSRQHVMYRGQQHRAGEPQRGHWREAPLRPLQQTEQRGKVVSGHRSALYSLRWPACHALALFAWPCTSAPDINCVWVEGLRAGSPTSP